MHLPNLSPGRNLNIQQKIAVIIVASILVTAIPTSFFLNQYLSSGFLDSALNELVEITRHQVDIASQRFTEGKPKLQGLARVLQKELQKPVKPDEINNFYREMELNDDGVWRNRKPGFDGSTESGVFLPPNPQESDLQKIIHIRIKKVMDIFGSAANKLHENVWYLSPHRSEIIFDKTFPEFAFDQQADNDYTNTPWVTYTTPELNPERKYVFTPPLFDPVPKVWMVSALFPLYLNDKWIGTLGEDMQLSKVLDSILKDLQIYSGTQQFLIDKYDNFILAGRWQEALESKPDASNFSIDNEPNLISLFNKDIGPDPKIISRSITVNGRRHVALGMMIEPVGWRYFKLVPLDEILAPSRHLFYGLVFIVFLVSMVSGLLISAAINRNIITRIMRITDAMRAYESGEKIQISEYFKGNDELCIVAREFDVMVDRVEHNLRRTRSALESLAELEELWKFALEGSGDAVWDWYIKSGVANFSPRWKKMLGYSEKEFPNLASAWESHLHPDDKPYVLRNLNNVLNDKQQSYQVEFRMKCKDGSWKWILARGMIVRRDSDDMPERMVGTHADISRQKEIEYQLRHSNDQMQSMLETSPIGVRITSEDGNNILFSNKSYFELVNAKTQDIKKITPQSLFIDIKEYKNIVNEINKGQSIKNRLFKLSVPQSNNKWTLASYLKIEYENQDAILGWFYDITEQLKYEESLKLHASVFDNAWEGIVITDARNNILTVNHAFTTITGYTQHEIKGKNPKVLSSGIQDEKFYQQMWRQISTIGHWRGEVWNRKKTGELYAEMLTVSAVRDHQRNTTHYVGIFTDITEIKNTEKLLKRMAHYDVLTGLPNRVLLADRLTQQIQQSKRSQKAFAVCFLDLDGFKEVNDKYGHTTGDKLLVEVSRRLSSEIRSGDTIARIGGDEFVLLLRNFANMDELELAITRINRVIAQPTQIEDHLINISVSIGLTLYPNDNADADTLIRHADISMYEAKQTGRNKFHFFDTNLDIQMHQHIQQLERIELALKNDEFCLFYQPKINLRTGEMVGMEALIRWNHPEKGLLTPAHFLPTIESNDLIVRLGDWVIDQALSQIEVWSDAGKQIPVSVNIAARQLQDKHFIEKLENSLKQHSSVSPSMLELEILESSALETLETAEIVRTVWKKLALPFALDDFGTGYSSLAYLKRLPVQTLKIDQTFVRDMLEDMEDQAIVKGVVNLAQVFNRLVIAEGVESQEHGIKLLQLGCELAQGYGIARPMPAQDVLDWEKVNIPKIFESNQDRTMS